MAKQRIGGKVVYVRSHKAEKLKKYETYLANAEKMRDEYGDRASAMAVYRQGQPVHSNESGYMKRMDSLRQKSVEADEKVEYWKNKIDSLKNSNVISSKDKTAGKQLNNRLNTLQSEMAKMKDANSYFKKHKTLEGFKGVDKNFVKQINESYQKHLSRAADYAKYGKKQPVFNPFSTKSTATKIRETKKRIDLLNK